LERRSWKLRRCGVRHRFLKRSQVSVCDVEDDEITVHIVNMAGASLPSTGGPGTTLLYLLGIVLTGLAGGGFVMKRRRRNRREAA
jgi:LPXTG-motif cell wall-anchored protein